MAKQNSMRNSEGILGLRSKSAERDLEMGMYDAILSEFQFLLVGLVEPF
jgi:hypothetical protein